ncbi:MAG: glycine cleavage system regulatory protein [Bacteroidia bacterium]
MDTSYIVTFIGNDRPGLVEELSQIIERHSGNWHESRLSQLGGKFAGLILISLPQEQIASLEAALEVLSERGLNVQVSSSGDALPPSPGRDITLTVLGPDRPGIVREISQALAQRQINVQEMESAVNRAPMSAEAIFSANISVRVPQDSDLDDLSERLEDIANQMTLEIELEPS